MGLALPPADVIYWIDQDAVIDIDKDGIVSCRVVCGKFVIELRAKPTVLVGSVGSGARAYAGYVARRSAKIVQLPRR